MDEAEESLNGIFVALFPQFGKLSLEVIQTHGEEGRMLYRGRVKLFDQMVITSKCYSSCEEAKAEVARQARGCIDEFVKIQNC